MARFTKEIEQHFIKDYEIGLFSTIPKVGEKNPSGELNYDGYERQKVSYTPDIDKGISINDIEFPLYTCDSTLEIVAAVTLDKDNVVTDVLSFKTSHLYNGCNPIISRKFYS